MGMKLLVVSHTPHYLRYCTPVGWGPTVREIDYLAQVFEQVVHVAPLHPDPPPASALPYTSKRVSFHPVKCAGGDNWRDKLDILRNAGEYVKTIRQEMRQADVVQVRCPAAISLMALLLLSLFRFPKYRWVKYAGNWRPESRVPWSYALQHWWLEKGLHRGVVSINGHWPGQPAHVFSFLNPSFTEEEIKQSQDSSGKKFQPPYQLLFVGKVDNNKGAGRVLQLAALLQTQGLDFDLHLVGDDPLKTYWEKWSREHGLDSRVVFHGWLPRPALADFYSRAHFLVLPSTSEGWPKVLSEAMAYGVVPLAGAVSCIPQILAETGAGMALPPLDIPAYKKALLDYVAQPDRWKAASKAGMATAPNFTYEHYLQAVGRMFLKAWGLELPIMNRCR